MTNDDIRELRAGCTVLGDDDFASTENRDRVIALCAAYERMRADGTRKPHPPEGRKWGS